MRAAAARVPAENTANPGVHTASRGVHETNRPAAKPWQIRKVPLQVWFNKGDYLSWMTMVNDDHAAARVQSQSDGVTESDAVDGPADPGPAWMDKLVTEFQKAGECGKSQARPLLMTWPNVS